MRTLYFSIITLFIFSIFSTSFFTPASAQCTILIQAEGSHFPEDVLNKSAQIISKRLKDFGSENCGVKVLPGKDQIQVTLFRDKDLKVTEELLTQRGSLAFYETCKREELEVLLKGKQEIFSLINSGTSHSGEARIGCVPLSSVENTAASLNKCGLNGQIRFVWEQMANGSEACLYALKCSGEKGALMTGEEIEKVSAHQDPNSKTQVISIVFKPAAIALWAEVTQKNINHAIAIVLDDKLLAAPVVRSAIAGGRAEITGNYTPSEAGYIAAIANNGVLPVQFSIVK